VKARASGLSDVHIATGYTAALVAPMLSADNPPMTFFS
jgi:hypothetical protein